MTVNLKQLAIITSAYTGILFHPKPAEVAKYVSDLLGRRVRAGELKELNSEIRTAMSTIIKEAWDFTNEPEEVEVEQEQLHESNKMPRMNNRGMVSVIMQLDTPLFEAIVEYANGNGLSFDQACENAVREKFEALFGEKLMVEV